MFSQDFSRDFDAILNAPEPFALVRFHDGEHAILENLPYSAASKWTIVGKKVWLRDELEKILRTKMDRFCIGISPPCCAPTATHYYRRNMLAERKYITYATIFSNRNFRRVPRLRAKFKEAAVVSCGKGDIKVPSNGVGSPWDVDSVVEQLLAVDRPILVAAGPCANLIIHRYWKRQDVDKRQTIIDVGAALDKVIHGHHTRHYQEVKSKALYHECEWEKWAPWAPVSKKAREKAERSARQHDIFESMQGKKLPGARNIKSRSPYRTVKTGRSIKKVTTGSKKRRS